VNEIFSRESIICAGGEETSALKISLLVDMTHRTALRIEGMRI